MEARYSQHRNRRYRRTPNFRAAATFLAIYTALYLAVAGAVQFMSSEDAAAAIVPQELSAPTAAMTVPAATTATSEPAAARSVAPEADELDSSRECQLDAGMDSACVFN